MSDADRLRVFLDGWDKAERCLIATLLDVPAEQRNYVIESKGRRMGLLPARTGEP